MASIPMEYFMRDSGDVNTLSHRRPKRAFEDVKHVVMTFRDEMTELTITFKPELGQRYNEETLADITEMVIRRALRKCPHTARLFLIGEHSPTGLWHYHGGFVGIPADQVSKLRRACTRELGRTEIKMIRYIESYKQYCLKSYEHNDVSHIVLEKWKARQHVFINIGDT